MTHVRGARARSALPDPLADGVPVLPDPPGQGGYAGPDRRAGDPAADARRGGEDVDMRIETIEAHPQYGSYPTGAPTRYTVTVRVVVVGVDDAADAAGMVAAAINGCGSIAEMEAERDAARAERDSLAQLMTTPLRIKSDNGEAHL